MSGGYGGSHDWSSVGVVFIRLYGPLELCMWWILELLVELCQLQAS